MHANWWTSVPALPASAEEKGYRRLWRQFADHTMNTWSDSADGTIQPGSRGFYVEKREDHLVPAFFENFSLFRENEWFKRVCSLAEIKTEGTISSLAWSYSYEEVLVGERLPRIADLTVMWRDDSGDAVAVIEAKKPGYAFKSLSQKDDPESGYYLRYSAMARIERRYQMLLIDENDRRHLDQQLRASPKVLTWQDLTKIALDLALKLPIDGKLAVLLHSRLSAHYGELGIFSEYGAVDAKGDAESYAYLRSFDAPKAISDWLVGSELFFGVRRHGAIVTAPYEWLETEYSAADWKSKKSQSTSQRSRPIWRVQ